MTAGGDSRSLFVVQRSFRRVRRGYDPEEVDRHLQLVSEWFSSGRGGRTAREAEQALKTREQTVTADMERARKQAEGERVEAEATLAGARLKAAGDLDAARREAERIVAEARAEADRVLGEARAEAERRVADRLAASDAEVAHRAERDGARGYVERRREADRSSRRPAASASAASGGSGARQPRRRYVAAAALRIASCASSIPQDGRLEPDAPRPPLPSRPPRGRVVRQLGDEDAVELAEADQKPSSSAERLDHLAAARAVLRVDSA